MRNGRVIICGAEPVLRQKFIKKAIAKRINTGYI
jgi:hypothetical protein